MDGHKISVRMFSRQVHTFVEERCSDFRAHLSKNSSGFVAMHKCLSLIVLSLLFSTQAAQACTELRPLNVQHLQYADTVVVGRIENYHLILDEDARQQRRAILATPDLPRMLRDALAKQGSFGTDYARFDVRVTEVLMGRPPASFSAVWDDMTFGEPKDVGTGPFLIALYDPKSPMPDDYSFGENVSLSRKLSLLTVMQASCARAFLMDINSKDAVDIRRFLKDRKQ